MLHAPRLWQVRLRRRLPRRHACFSLQFAPLPSQDEVGSVTPVGVRMSLSLHASRIVALGDPRGWNISGVRRQGFETSPLFLIIDGIDAASHRAGYDIRCTVLSMIF